MLIAIGILALVVVVLAHKTAPGDQQAGPESLPPPPTIPATGTSGIPSPATEMDPIAGTNRGILALWTNGRYPVLKTGTQTAPVSLSPHLVSDMPPGPPDQSKDLQTNATTTQPLKTIFSNVTKLERL